MIALEIDPKILEEALSFDEAALQKAALLVNGTGLGNDFLGWLDLPETPSRLVKEIEQTADRLAKIADKVVVIGIGGSYLGTRAIVSALKNPFDVKTPQLLYAGHHLSQDELFELLEYLKTENYAIIVISKSGTTTEPAVAFRLLKQSLENKYGQEGAKERIVCITDAKRGALKTMANTKGYQSFVIDDAVGGRYSVLSPVGLLPIATARLNINAFLDGAKKMKETLKELSFQNKAFQYAAFRNYMLRQGKKVEVLASFEPRLHYFIEWWKQLFGESEGKNGKGLMPAGMIYTTDLHSMGQYMQEGQRLMFETFVSIEKSRHQLTVPCAQDDLDGLNFLAGKPIEEINQKAEQGTILAHRQGGVPTIKLKIEQLDEYHLGALVYFFEFACGLSAYMLGVNPFDQPGVEAYKNNMFALLNKPGYEKQHQEIQQYIKE